MKLSRETKLFISISAAQVVALLGPSLFPMIMGAGIDFRHLEYAEAGMLGTLYLFTKGLGSLAVIPLLNWFPKRMLMIAGVLCAIVADFIIPFAPNSALKILLSVGGLSTGIVLGASYAGIADSDSPDRLCGKMILTAGLILAGICTLFPTLLDLVNHQWGFLLVGFYLLALPCIFLMPAKKEAAQGAAEAQSCDSNAGLLLVIFVLAGYTISGLSRQTLWTFVERRGLVVGFTGEQVGLILGITAFIGLLGALLASSIGTKWGRTKPLAIGILMTALGMWFIMFLSSKPSFIGTRSVWAFGENFYTPFYIGVIAAMDPKGRLATLAAGLGSLGQAAGPTLGGTLVEFTGYARDITIISCLIQASALLLVLPAALKFDRLISSSSS